METPETIVQHYYVLKYSTTSTGGERTSDEPYTKRNPKYLTHNIVGLEKFINNATKTKEKNYQNEYSFYRSDSLLVKEEKFNFEKVYCVLVFYIDGDTFSTTHGNLHFDSVHGTQEEAIKRAEQIEAEKDDGAITDPWKGYFNELESVEIHGFKPSNKITSVNTKFKYVNHFA